jgi:hypothetical protein
MPISDVVYQRREILHYLADDVKQDLIDAAFARDMAKLARRWECVPLGSDSTVNLT